MCAGIYVIDWKIRILNRKKNKEILLKRDVLYKPQEKPYVSYDNINGSVIDKNYLFA